MKIGNGVDIMLVCNRCFRPLKDCKCNRIPTLVEIDDDILEHIRLLNEKGYYTEYCCSGHLDDIWFRPYITFKDFYDFETQPKFFEYNKRLNGLYYIVKWENKTDSEWRNQIATESRKELLDWIKQLPNREEV